MKGLEFDNLVWNKRERVGKVYTVDGTDVVRTLYVGSIGHLRILVPEGESFDVEKIVARVDSCVSRFSSSRHPVQNVEV